MFKAIGQMFNALFTIFSAIDKGAKSIDHLAGIAEAEAKGLADQMDVERTARLQHLTEKLLPDARREPANSQ